MHGYTGVHPVEDYKKEYGLFRDASVATIKRIGRSILDNEYWAGRKHTKISIKRMAETQKRVLHDEKTKKKISLSLIGNKRARGMDHADEFKEYISKRNLALWNKARKKNRKLKQGDNRIGV